MSGQNFYILAALPSLGQLGSAPPLSLAELVEHVHPAPSARELVETILLSDDLVQREAHLAGELDKPSPAVLTPEQVRSEEPMGGFLILPGEPVDQRAVTDAVMAGYFRHAAAVAARRSSDFLAAWVGFEVAMRNALTDARAKALQLDAADYLVAAELGDRDADFAGVIAEWSASANPLAGMRILDEARWDWLCEHEGYFSFGDDELAAYAAKLVLIHRWNRFQRAAQTNQARSQNEGD